jgi:lipopolysaccharide transport system ATP-binding protein
LLANIIEVQALSKAYQLGVIGTGTLSRDIGRAWAKFRGKEDPYLKIGEENDRTRRGQGDIVWSLKDVNFNIRQGEAMGIIGRNGAGKSTLLKIMSRITSPTSGQVRIKGRVASLLEVGTGFHPELTGRENMYLNGAILGMRNAEIKRKCDEIVDFSGVERYIDTPVKRYSSGMYVRLAFAVAAHLESEILIVDEVLSVGDAEFQKKCLGKMSDISQGEGRTILFVSHNMGAIEAFCSRILHLHNGCVVQDSRQVVPAIKHYLNGERASGGAKWVRDDKRYDNEFFNPVEMYLQGADGGSAALFNRNDEVRLTVRGTIPQEDPRLQVGIALYDEHQNLVCWSFHTDMTPEVLALPAGACTLTMTVPLKLLNEGTYTLSLGIALYQTQWICEPDLSAPSIELEIHGGYLSSPYWTGRRPGVIAPLINWKKQ